MGTHPIFESDFDCLTDQNDSKMTNTDAKKVIRQVEYYFGDSNMQRDKFLQDEVAKDAEGWVPLTTMLKFKRLGDLVNGEANSIVASLKASKSDLVEIASVELKIRRNPELKVPAFDDNYKRQQKARTCYVKGFGVDETLDVLQDYFDSYGLESVFMRRVPLSKQFKGSVFVTFKTQQNCDDFMNEAETKYKEEVLNKRTSKSQDAKTKKSHVMVMIRTTRVLWSALSSSAASPMTLSAARRSLQRLSPRSGRRLTSPVSSEARTRDLSCSRSP